MSFQIIQWNCYFTAALTWGMGKLLVLFKGHPLLSLQITSCYSHVSKWAMTGRGTQGVTRKPFCAVTQALVLGHQVWHCHSVSLYLWAYTCFINPYGFMKMKFISWFISASHVTSCASIWSEVWVERWKHSFLGVRAGSQSARPRLPPTALLWLYYNLE